MDLSRLLAVIIVITALVCSRIICDNSALEEQPPDQSYTITFGLEPIDFGLIEFDGSVYGNDFNPYVRINSRYAYNITEGNYEIAAFPSPGYTFDRWATSGGVSLLSEAFYQSRTICAVTGDGTLIMYQKLTDSPTCTIESCDANGNIRNHFDSNEDIFIKGSGFAPNAIYNIYVVMDTEWVDDMLIPTRVPNSVELVSTNELGDILITGAWSGNMSVDGTYDMIIDYYGDGNYDRKADPIDDNDIMITAGFDIPEFSSYSFLSILMTILTVIMIYKRKMS